MTVEARFDFRQVQSNLYSDALAHPFVQQAQEVKWPGARM
jgi:hypothetical protein